MPNYQKNNPKARDARNRKRTMKVVHEVEDVTKYPLKPTEAEAVKVIDAVQPKFIEARFDMSYKIVFDEQGAGVVEYPPTIENLYASICIAKDMLMKDRADQKTMPKKQQMEKAGIVALANAIWYLDMVTANYTAYLYKKAKAQAAVEDHKTNAEGKIILLNK